MELHRAGQEAREEALDALGDEAARFTAAIARYVNAVNVAAVARSEWERDGRPMICRHANGTIGVDPRIQVMEQHDRAAARYGAALGLDPAAARRMGRVGLYGRPVGATSAPDRRPPRLLRTVDVTGVEEPPEVQLRKSDRDR
jgi:hypothetical protein